jgi:hypothetical protein
MKILSIIGLVRGLLNILDQQNDQESEPPIPLTVADPETIYNPNVPL